MCLLVNKVNDELPLKTAEKDIPCLKIVQIRENSLVLTPYRYVPVTSEVLRGEKDFLPERFEPGDYEFESCGIQAEVYAGAVHIYACTRGSTRIIMNEALSMIWPRCPHEVAVYLCTIPKGTEYMEGTFNGHKCYGSKAVRFKRELMRLGGNANTDAVFAAYAKVEQELAPVIEEIEFEDECD